LPGDFSLALGATTLDSTITGQHTIAVTISRGAGFTDAVALTATGLPTGVTAAFAQATLPDGTDTTDLTLTVDASAAPGTTDITVTGTAGTLAHTATLAVTLSYINVSGTVRGGAANTTVRLVGKAATTTDGSGAFNFADVIVPYDIYVVGVNGVLGVSSYPAVNYYRGLTRTNPVLTRPSQSVTLFGLVPASGTVSGTRMGSGNNTDPVAILWSNGGNVATSLTAQGGYSFTATWPQGSTNTGTLYGLQITRGTLGAPTAYPGYGTTAATISSNTTTTVSVTMAAPGTAALTGTITSPSGYPAPTLTLTQQFGTRNAELWTATTTAATSMIPLIAAGTTAFHATTTSGGATTSLVFPGLNAATDVTYELPRPAGQTGPANNASNVTTSTPIEYTTTPMTVYRVSITDGSANFHVFTTEGSITIPNVSEVPLPSGRSYTWQVTGFGPHSHVDAAADATALETVVKADFEGPMHFETISASRTFATQ
jgi:hypothetical protein